MIEDLIATRNLSIRTDLITLKNIVESERFYSIPLYQRLYVWGEDQVTTLLEDLERAIKTPDNFYFLGGTMIISNQSKYDLIDGQQRFTTLWLLSYELKNELEAFAYAHINKVYVKRLSFAIRDFANQYFTNPDNYSQLTKEEKLQLEGITQSQKTIQTFLNAKERGNISEFKKNLTKFLFEKVAFIETEMPAGIDENRLFEVLNNRGVQLQHHEIIKSKLIQKLSNNDEKRKYAQIWEACSIMDNYIEKNVKDVCGFKWGDITQKVTEEDTEIGLPSDIINRIAESTTDYEDKHLNEILDLDKYELNDENDEYDYDSGKVRSIISFPMFLQHSLRIFIFNNKYEGFTTSNVPEVNEKKLIETFEKHFKPYLDEANVKAFIELLLKLRINFDKYVIKWIERESNQEIHLIKRLYQNKNVLQRKEPISNEGFALLQSMLYHSQQITTLYWLTPFLHKTLQEDNLDSLYKYLLKLDNLMFCSELTEDLSLRSWKMIENDFNNFKANIDALEKPNGTTFWSYWFYKTDFILWYLKASEKGDDWKNYRMTKKNSVEHISPQNRRDYDENTLCDVNETLSDDQIKKRIDDFGNLVLLAVGMNSEYSNKSFREKRTSFIEKKRLDSLKSALIFENEIWNWDLCEQHRKEMIKLFEEYFIKTMDNVTT